MQLFRYMSRVVPQITINNFYLFIRKDTIILTLFCLIFSSYGKILYVNCHATGDNNGSSWHHAYVDLQKALAEARTDSRCNEIWVAQGEYKPGNQRTHSFSMINGVQILGGFLGSEDKREKRNFIIHPTILSGDIGIINSQFDNCYNVFYHSNELSLNNSAVLDGFFVSGGCASLGRISSTSSKNKKSIRYLYGGGMYNSGNVSPTIRNCIFKNNDAIRSGGGMYNEQNSNPRVEYCNFISNESKHTSSGAGMCNNYNSNPVLIHCKFIDNKSDWDYGRGGGLSNLNGSSPIIINCFFAGNRATKSGGGMLNVNNAHPHIINCVFSENICHLDPGNSIANFNSSPHIINCTFNGNTFWEVGAEIYNEHSNPIITNSIIWNLHPNYPEEIIMNVNSTPIVSYCIIKGGYPEGPGNSNEQPLFINPAGSDGQFGTIDDNLRLRGISPGINAGLNNAVPFDAYDIDNDMVFDEKLPFDYDGHDRFSVGNSGDIVPSAPIVDIGAFEAHNRVYVNIHANGNNTGCTWKDAFVDLQDALHEVQSDDLKNTIWVAQGTYVPGKNRDDYFALTTGIDLYGGFSGTESCIDHRNTDKNKTILSGDIDQDETLENNTYHVLKYIDTEPIDFGYSITLDGFEITGGNANGEEWEDQIGGGIFISGRVAYSFITCNFENNSARHSGGAVYQDDQTETEYYNCRFSNNSAKFGGAIHTKYRWTRIVDCMFLNNSALDAGGAIRSYYCGPTIQRCSFWGNSAKYKGGAIALYDDWARINNCLFSGNSSLYGGAISCRISDPTIINCTFSLNSGDLGGAIYTDGREYAPIILNSILYNNGTTELYVSKYFLIKPIVKYSTIRGGFPGIGNIDQLPDFIDFDGDDNVIGTSDDNPQLAECSPCIDRGNNDIVVDEFDLAGYPRIFSKNEPQTVDIGACEFYETHNLFASIQCDTQDWEDVEVVIVCKEYNSTFTKLTNDEGTVVFTALPSRDFKITLHGSVEKNQSSISGRLVKNGKPLINVTLMLHDSKTRIHSVETNHLGDYVFTNIPEGSIKIKVQSDLEKATVAHELTEYKSQFVVGFQGNRD